MRRSPTIELVARRAPHAANIEEVMVGEQVQGDETAVSMPIAAMNARSASAKISSPRLALRILRRGKRNQPLPPEAVERNHKLSLTPAAESVTEMTMVLDCTASILLSAARNALACSLACIGLQPPRWHACAYPLDHRHGQKPLSSPEPSPSNRTNAGGNPARKQSLQPRKDLQMRRFS